jgi:hypothetical protein
MLAAARVEDLALAPTLAPKGEKRPLTSFCPARKIAKRSFEPAHDLVSADCHGSGKA